MRGVSRNGDPEVVYGTAPKRRPTVDLKTNCEDPRCRHKRADHEPEAAYRRHRRCTIPGCPCRSLIATQRPT